MNSNSGHTRQMTIFLQSHKETFGHIIFRQLHQVFNKLYNYYKYIDKNFLIFFNTMYR